MQGEVKNLDCTANPYTENEVTPGLGIRAFYSPCDGYSIPAQRDRGAGSKGNLKERGGMECTWRGM
jgi:hypothetical protein